MVQGWEGRGIHGAGVGEVSMVQGWEGRGIHGAGVGEVSMVLCCYLNL